MTEKMSPKEKVVAALERRTCVVPVVPLSSAHSAILQGVRIPALRKDAKLNVEAQLKAWERYKYDGVFAYSDMGMFWEGMGGRIKLSEDGFPSQEPMMARLEDAETLKFPDLEKEGTLREALKTLEELNNKLGVEVAILIGTIAPFTFAGALRGIDSFMVDLIKKPDLAENLLERCQDFLLTYMDELKRRGALVVLISDPMASLIRPTMYERFALPYQKELFNKIRENRMYSILHICGDATAILNRMAESGTDCLWLDQKVDLAQARRTVGSLCLMGNVDPVITLLRGTRKDVETEAKTCIDKAAKDGGFILSAGCEVPMKTPPENLVALVETARNYSPQT